MITSEDLEKIPVFAGVEEQERRRLARRAADIQLEPGEWLIREGEEAHFFVILEGELEILKDIGSQRRHLGRGAAGEFTGEVSIFLGTSNNISLRALTHCRAARFERQQLQELVRDSPSAGELIFQIMSSRVARAQQVARETPSSRVEISGSKYDTNCRAIRSFLSANRIQYDWSPIGSEPDPEAGITVSVEGTPLEYPTVRRVAEALGFQTVPKHDHYDLIIVGGGPAGMAGAVYSASEGLNVLLVERFAAGGQAGTSSRIENYLGFAAGISGDELTERALKQVNRFGVEMLFKRNVEKIESLQDGHCVTLDGGDRVRASVVLLATGVSWHRLEFEGHDQFLGRGISYGATRFDGIAVTGHRIFIVGGGNSAGQAALFYSGYAAEVVMLVRGAGLTLSMSQYLIQQIRDKANIRVEPYTQVTGAHGENHLEQITTVTRSPDGPEFASTHDAKALFILTGAVAKTDWLPPAIERDANGYICTGRNLTTWPLDRSPFAFETSMPGVFCAGDVRHNSVKRVASGVGEGSMAIAFIHEYLALVSPQVQADL
ncbi:MAG TPA: FAD-dependent oxidoreductase [Acidobacteriaceae bacterium]